MRTTSFRRQAGAMMLEVSLALLISALAAGGALRESIKADERLSANIEADSLAMYRQALQDYVDENYANLQANLPITKAAVTLPAGTGAGQTYKPTVANLLAMGYLPTGFSNTTLIVDGGQFDNAIERLPAGCTPSTACNVEGLAWITQRILIRGTNFTNAPLIGQILTRIGGNAGTSLEMSPATISGIGGTWTRANPVAGAGVVGARFGFGASALGNFVRINDTRDPNLLGNLTVVGNTSAANISSSGQLTVTGNSTLSGNVSVGGTVSAVGNIRSNASLTVTASGCNRAGLDAAGMLDLRNAGCESLVTGDGNTGTLSVAQAGGIVRARMDGAAGTIAAFDATGAQRASLDGATGRLQGVLLNVSATANVGGACGTAGDVAQDANPGGGLIICRSGTWRRMGLELVTMGGACSAPGSLGATVSSESAICRSGTWQSVNDRLPQLVPMETWYQVGAANVPAPACGAGGTPDIVASPLHTGADYGGVPPRNRFALQVTGSGPWTVNPVLIDSSGAGYSSGFDGSSYDFGWNATTLCRY